MPDGLDAPGSAAPDAPGAPDSEAGGKGGLDFAPSPEEERLARAVEALVFASDEPVGAERLAEVFAEVTGDAPGAEAVASAIERVNAAYEAAGRPFRIESWGGGYQMATQEEWAPFVKTLLAGPRQRSLSRSLSETLAVVAYRQPVTRPEVDFVRGVSADYAIRKLMELDLVDVEGRSESLGRPLLYGTTDHFLEEFGLAGLDDLPTLREVKELLDDPNFNEERAKLLQLRREEGGTAPEAASVDADPSDAANPGDAPSGTASSGTGASATAAEASVAEASVAEASVAEASVAEASVAEAPPGERPDAEAPPGNSTDTPAP